MKDAMSWMMRIQLLVFAPFAFLSMFVPRWAIAFARADRVEDLPNIAAGLGALSAAGATLGTSSERLEAILSLGQSRLIGVLFIPVMAISLVTLLRSEIGFRRDMARIFAVFFTAWSVAFWYTQAGGVGGRLILLFFGFTAPMAAIANLTIFLGLRPDSDLARARGAAVTRPPALWALWMVQAFLLLAIAVIRGFWPEMSLNALSNGEPSGIDHLRAIAHTRMVAPFTLAFCLFTINAMRQRFDWLWRPLVNMFWVTFITWGSVLVFNWFGGAYSTLAGRLAIPAFLFGIGNFVLSRAKDDVYDEAQSRDNLPGSWGWNLMDLVAGPIMAMQVLTSKRRASHLMGIGAKGRFVPKPDADVPPHDLFTEGADFPLLARFANLTELDDAASDVRGAAIKFSDDLDHSPFDVLLNTGSFCPAENIVGFAGFVFSKFVPAWGSKILVGASLPKREGGVAGLRRAPDSYAKLFYHTQKITFWTDQKNVRHLVRYRLAPKGLRDDDESGILNDEDASQIWLRDRNKTEERPTNYLRQEMKNALDNGTVEFVLLAQFHTPRLGDSLAWYNPGLDWGVDEHPWLELGQVKLETALSDETAEVLRFNPANRPVSLGIPKSPGILDYRSVADSEFRVVRRLQELRLWMYRNWKLPKFGDVTKN